MRIRPSWEAVREKPRLKLTERRERSRTPASSRATSRRSSGGRLGKRLRLSRLERDCSQKCAISSVKRPLRTDGTQRQARAPRESGENAIRGDEGPTRKPPQSPG